MKNKNLPRVLVTTLCTSLVMLLTSFIGPEAAHADTKMNRWWIFGGADVGMAFYGVYNNNVAQSGRNGAALGVHGFLAYYWPQFVLDGGLGWSSIQSSGTYPNGNVVSVSTKTGHIDFSPRWRIPHTHWQVGLDSQYWLATDNGLNPDPTQNTTSNNAIFGGIRGLYEWVDGGRMRVGAHALTDIGVTGPSAYVVQIFFEWGFSIFAASTETTEPIRSKEQISERDLEQASAYTPPNDPLPIATPEPIPEATPWQETLPLATPAPTIAPTPTPKPIPKERLVMTLDVNDLPFEFDSARMPKYNMDRVREIGRFLGEHKDLWRTIVVSGHTDDRGKADYNNKLSKARADTVRQLLGEGGAPIGRIKTVGYGQRKPKVKGHNEKAWAKNRRVELEFRGVKDIRLIQGAFGNVPEGEETR